MGLSKFHTKYDKIIRRLEAKTSLISDAQISEAIIEDENEFFHLRFKKATRQNFNSSDIKTKKYRVARLKTFTSWWLRRHCTIASSLE